MPVVAALVAVAVDNAMITRKTAISMRHLPVETNELIKQFREGEPVQIFAFLSITRRMIVNVTYCNLLLYQCKLDPRPEPLCCLCM